jgi:hypothetical protein
MIVEAMKNPALASSRVAALHSAINDSFLLSLTQAQHWYAVALHFKPDVIIELGRGVSTAIFTEAANLIGAKVKSFDLQKGWTYRSRLNGLVSENWSAPLEVISADITATDFAPYVEGCGRVLVVWDCHGYEIADAILSRLMPLIADKQHLVVIHDIADNRIVGQRPYGDRAFWRGMGDYYANRGRAPRSVVNLGWTCSYMDQVIPIVDFCWRNGIELHSPDFELQRAGSLAEAGQWVYFTLNETRERNFPLRAKPRSIADIAVDCVKHVLRPLRRLIAG